MYGTYKLTYRVWPYSAPVDKHDDYREACGPEVQTYTFTASDFDDAYKQAKHFMAGVKTNKRCWNAPIQSLELVKG